MRKQAGATNYCTRVVDDLTAIGPDAWQQLLGSDRNPFMRYSYLHALHASGCASEATGWEPQYLTLWTDDATAKLAAAVPLYRKHHSYGEYVFDWSWADAYRRHDVAYYPKWLVGVPFTPVPGPRLLAIDEQARATLAHALVAHARTSGLSSLHALFVPAGDAALFDAQGLLTRRAVQFHWFNRGYANFDAYLSALTQPKRKKVRAERRKVDDAGITCVRKTGEEIREADWKLFARCYASTYAAHYSTPYLSLEFFLELAQRMPETLLMVVAQRGRKPIAAALALYDADRLYGRYWGALESHPCLHFEASYYQMIEFAIERGLAVFEGGAQGEHKLARGFEPVTTLSSHWLAHPAFAAAVERAVAREAGGIDAYVDELNERSALRLEAR